MKQHPTRKNPTPPPPPSPDTQACNTGNLSDLPNGAASCGERRGVTGSSARDGGTTVGGGTTLGVSTLGGVTLVGGPVGEITKVTGVTGLGVWWGGGGGVGFFLGGCCGTVFFHPFFSMAHISFN